MKAAQQVKPSPQIPQDRRMNLSAVSRGRIDAPLRILLFGVEGIGKSSWAANAPSPVFLCGESGTDFLDVARLPEPKGWHDVLEAIRVLTDEPHDFKTLAIDTVDAIEPMLWDFICKRDDKESIESYGYAKGYIAALDEWRIFLAALERLRRTRRMHLVLIAHSYIKPFKNPEGEDYDRYELKLHIKAGGLLKEWVDDVLFAHFETFAVKESDAKGAKAKGVSNGARIVETVRTAAWDAKNRHALPPTLPLDYQAFADAVAAHQPADPEKLKASIAAKLSELASEKLNATISALVEKAEGDAVELSKIDNKLTATLSARKGA